MQRMSVLSAKRHSSMSSSAGSSSLDIPSSPSSAAVASEAAAKAAPTFPMVKGEVEREEDSSSSSGCEPDLAYEKMYRSYITIQIEDHPL